MVQPWTWTLSNAGNQSVVLLLEPWAEEFELPPRSTVSLDFSAEGALVTPGSIERTADYLILWIERGTVAVEIDGIRQQTGAAVIPIPELAVRESRRRSGWQWLQKYLCS